MNLKKLAVLLLGCLAILFLAASPASAQCNVKLLSPISASPNGAPDLNAEGLTERAGDIVIYGAGCFTSGSHITVGYNAWMTYPSTPTPPGSVSIIAKKGVYWNSYDPSEALSITDVEISSQVISTGYVTDITFTIDTGTNNASAYIVVENLRFDVTATTCVGITPLPCQSVGDTHTLNAVVGRDNPTVTLNPFPVGNVKKTVDGRVVYVGWGFEDGVCPFPGYCGYPNKGATTGSLISQAWWAFLTNGAWVTDFPFRRSASDDITETSPNAADPIQSLGPTDLVVDVENIMSGVTVTVPNALVACNEGPEATWTWIGGDKSKTGGNLVAIYRTTQSARVNPTGLFVATTNGPADPGCDTYSPYPLISVQIGNPSGLSADGSMEAYLRVVMGPAPTQAFSGDDAQPNAVPRYLKSVSATGHPSREIFGDTNAFYQPYFFLNPTQTVILYPYVVTGDGWETGIEVGNTGLDTPVFGNSGQDGKLDFYFFGTDGAPFSYTAKHTDAGQIGLDAQDDLDAGKDYAITLSNILSAAGHPGPFVGYIIVVAHFNYGHGAGMVFSSTGSSFLPGLILGGKCSYNPNQATEPPPIDTGSPVTVPFGSVTQPPACSSARQGDITKLPERLLM